jgi:hypothetical protein
MKIAMILHIKMDHIAATNSLDILLETVNEKPGLLGGFFTATTL